MTIRLAATYGVCFALCSSLSIAKEPRAIDLFDAMERGAVETKFIPTSSAKANIIFKNLTVAPIFIKLPLIWVLLCLGAPACWLAYQRLGRDPAQGNTA